MSTICLTDGMYINMFEIMVEQQIGHIQMNHPDYPGKRSMYDAIEDAPEVLASIDATEGVKAAPRTLVYVSARPRRRRPRHRRSDHPCGCSCRPRVGCA